MRRFYKPILEMKDEVDNLLNAPCEPILDDYVEKELLRIEKMYKV